MFLPPEVYLQKTAIYAESELFGVSNLVIARGGRFDLSQDGHVNSPSKATALLNSISILTGGIFYQRTSEPAKVTVNLTDDLRILAGALMDVSQIYLRAHNIVIDIAGMLTARGRGFVSMKGEQPGHQSSTAASGAGHGGAGGQSSLQDIVGKSYGSFEMPLGFGSGGGQGYQDLVRCMLASYKHEMAYQISPWITNNASGNALGQFLSSREVQTSWYHTSPLSILSVSKHNFIR